MSHANVTSYCCAFEPRFTHSLCPVVWLVIVVNLFNDSTCGCVQRTVAMWSALGLGGGAEKEQPTKSEMKSVKLEQKFENLPVKETFDLMFSKELIVGYQESQGVKIPKQPALQHVKKLNVTYSRLNGRT